MQNWSVFKAAAAGTWLLCGVPAIADILNGQLRGWAAVAWLIAFALFGAALLAHLYGRGRLAGHGRHASYALVALQSVLGLIVSYLTLTYLDGVGTTIATLVIVAAELPPLMPLRRAVAYVAAQTVAFVSLALTQAPVGETLAFGVALLAFQLFAFGGALVAERLAAANAELHATRARLAEKSRVEERLRIARDLHDTLGHHLVGLSIQLDLARRLTNGKAAEHLERAHAVSQQLLRDVREVVSQTRESTHFDLTRAARGMAAQHGRLAVHVEVTGADDLGDTPAAHALLRSMQEIITNANKHSGARNLWIRLEARADGIELQASDDGRGATALKWGNGLTGMRERFEQLGGRLEVGAKPGRGFDVHAFVPRAST